MTFYYQPAGGLERRWDRFIATSSWQQVRARRRRLISTLRKQRFLVSGDVSLDFYTRARRLAFLNGVERHILGATKRAVKQHWCAQRLFWLVSAE
jgi:hypothetical protein